MKDKFTRFWRPIKSKSDHVFALVQIGSGRKLLFFDFFLLLLIGREVYKLQSLNLDYLSFLGRLWRAFGFYHVVIGALLVFVPPVANALVNFVLRGANVFKKSIPLRFRTRNLIFGLHFALSIVFVAVVTVSDELKVLSGYSVQLNETEGLVFSSYEYSPLYPTFIKVLTGGGVLLVILRLISILVPRRDFLKEYDLWFKLADSSSEYFPKQRASLIFVNTASMAPSITWVIEKEEASRHAYQKMVPTSDEAKECLKQAAERSRVRLREYLFTDSDSAADFSIEFLPLTSRCLEIGLTQIDDLKTIVVSPYEHPSQAAVVEWFVSLNPTVSPEIRSMDYAVLDKPRSEQMEWLLDDLKSAIPADTSGKVAILISEVYYVTGIVIDVGFIIDQLRADFRTSNLVFIVDGSQSVGNLLSPFRTVAPKLHRQDFYYFSCHKWLLSPNTCGVYIAEQNPSRYRVKPYDVFGTTLPSATIDPGVIFGIESSLEYLIADNSHLLLKFHQKSQTLKSYFKSGLGEKFEIVDAGSEAGCFFAVRPRTGNKWREDTVHSFWSQIRQEGVDLTVVPLEGRHPSNWWLRISFPYFLQIHLLKQLIKHLNARVILIN
jgi:hypothetical protein